MPQTLFISDLHLDPGRPEITALFLRFLREQAAGSDALYILGDLFEFWVGDDATQPFYPEVVAGLRALTDAGTPVYFMAGNRDFLVGRRFCKATGMTLLRDPSCIDLYDQPCLLMHGDSLCVDDVDYQRFRRLAHNRLARALFLALPGAWRRRIAERIRGASSKATQRKNADIMDVNAQAVEQALSAANCHLLIHGHTHRPSVHRLQVAGKAARRIVLGDWYEQGSLLRCRPGTQELEQLV